MDQKFSAIGLPCFFRQLQRANFKVWFTIPKLLANKKIEDTRVSFFYCHFTYVEQLSKYRIIFYQLLPYHKNTPNTLIDGGKMIFLAQTIFQRKRLAFAPLTDNKYWSSPRNLKKINFKWFLFKELHRCWLLTEHCKAFVDYMIAQINTFILFLILC